MGRETDIDPLTKKTAELIKKILWRENGTNLGEGREGTSCLIKQGNLSEGSFLSIWFLCTVQRGGGQDPDYLPLRKRLPSRWN